MELGHARERFSDPWIDCAGRREQAILPESNLPWWRHDRPWGFRFSTLDAAIFAGGGVSTLALWPEWDSFALIVPYLLGHFFLFCNTFRVGGERSLIWVFAFLANVYLLSRTGNLRLSLALQGVVTIVLIGQCVLSRNYHGWGCARVNPHGYRAGALSEGAFTRTVLLTCRVPRRLVELLVGRNLNEFDGPSKS